MERLHFRRIGYSPVDVPLRDSVAGRIDVVMTRLPTQLPPVKATTLAQCPARDDADDALALWEQARSGMLTSMVARESKTAWISVLAYKTAFDGDDEQPRTVSRFEFDSATNAFMPGGRAEDLAKSGYGVADLFGTTFLGPDDGVLFDETFLATHCFSLGESTDSTLSLEFEPAKGRNKIIEIQGTVLFRRTPLELKSVQYRYTGVPSPIDKARPGGALQFEHMPNGITMIQRWHIRGAFAVYGAGGQAFPGRTGVVIRGGNRPGGTTRMPRGVSGSRVSVQATEMGAMIELMQWPGVPPFIAPLATVSGVVIDKATKRPLANTPLRFYSTPFATTTDSSGRFSMVDVLPGMYAIDAGDFELEKYNAAPPLIGPTAIKYGRNELTLEGIAPPGVVSLGCADKMDGRVVMPKAMAGDHAVFGIITTSTGAVPPKDQQFTVEFTPVGAVAGTPPFPLKGKADKSGRFRICGLSPGTARIRSATRTGLVATADLTIDPARPYQLVTLKLPITTGR